MTVLHKSAPYIALLTLAACTTIPEGPSVMVLPGSGKSFDLFRSDDYGCQSYAQSQLRGTNVRTAAEDSGVRSAALGTVLGAVAGAAFNGGHGAAVGAGTGLAVGGLAGTQSGQVAGYGVQRRYDNAYLQCMYAHGNRIPLPRN